MARVTLFDQASISPYSRFFWLENQVTVVGHGLQPDDYITFEAVETNAAPMAKNCGCDFVPAGAISLNSILELTCAACNGVVSPVVLTAANPVVVLDHPQGFYLRAVYHGTGLATGEVIVRATDTNTRDLTDALRGCPERCPDYVGTLCITPGTRAFGVNDPRDPEATVPIMREGNIVGYIYPTPRSHAPVPVTEDPCQPCDGNTVGAIIGYAMPWDGPETECLCLCYECQDVSWEQVGDAFCRNDTLWVNEISNCGRTRERDTGEACCVPNWTNSGAPYCVGDNCMQDQVDGCGNTRTVAGTGCSPECGICVPNWTNVGTPYCVGDDCVQLQQDGCGNTRTVPSAGCSPECGACVPNYVATSTYECRADGRYYQWFMDANNCGGANGQWQDVGPVTWTPTGEEQCVGGFIQVRETNQCGDSRWRVTTTPCGGVQEPIGPPGSGWGGACCAIASGEVRVEFTRAGRTMTVSTSCAGVIASHVWLPSGANAADYEFRIARTTPPTSSGTWVNGAATHSIAASCTGDTPRSVNTHYILYWRAAGDTDPTGTPLTGEEVLQVGCGGSECT